MNERIRRALYASVHVAAIGSSALHLATGSRESLAGRFEKLTLAHWSASPLAQAFELERPAAADLLMRKGSYPGTFLPRDDVRRRSAYVRDAILEAAVGRTSSPPPSGDRRCSGRCSASARRRVVAYRIGLAHPRIDELLPHNWAPPRAKPST